jgi:hypothetical protein
MDVVDGDRPFRKVDDVESAERGVGQFGFWGSRVWCLALFVGVWGILKQRLCLGKQSNQH